jgi:hypothetical protein
VNLKAFQTGYGLGLSGSPFPYEERQEPVAYLYNEIELPTLIPELTPEQAQEYPYIMMYKSSSNFATVWFTKRPAVCYPSGTDYSVGFLKDETFLSMSYCYAGTIITPMGWGSLSEYDYTYDSDSRPVHLNTFWANYDIYYDGTSTVYLATTDPVPVYE